MAAPLHCSQNHSPLGAVDSPKHWKWNHSMGQSLRSQAIMSPHSGPPQIHHRSELSRGALPVFLKDFPFLFAVAFWAPAWRCFLTSLRCLTHISTSLERSNVCFANCSIWTIWNIFVVFLENYACFIIQAKTLLNCNINILFLSEF